LLGLSQRNGYASRSGEPLRLTLVVSDDERVRADIAKFILKTLSKPESLITFVKDRPGHDRRYAMEHTKITQELGWKPKYKFNDMLPQTVKWYVKNQGWAKRIQQKTGVINAHIDLWKPHKL